MNKKILMTHLYYGDPSEEFSLKLANTLLQNGADYLEIGIPYTDPVCDGEIFQSACKRAIEAGMTPPKVLEGVQKIKKHSPLSTIFVTSYYAPIVAFGVEKFILRLKKIGVKGIIIPDLLLEEQNVLQKICKKNDISLIEFATIYSNKKRIQSIIEASTDPPAGEAGFIYCIALPGVTGDGEMNSRQLIRVITDIKRISDKKILVGFGIHSPDGAKEIIRAGADGLIIGSAIARLYREDLKLPENTLASIGRFIQSMRNSMDIPIHL